MTIYFRMAIDPRPTLSLVRFQELLDVSPDAVRDLAAATYARMCDMPFDALIPCRPGRHAVEAMPLLVQGQPFSSS
jgi:hypothetical protein